MSWFTPGRCDAAHCAHHNFVAFTLSSGGLQEVKAGYNVSLSQAARQFDVTEADVHSWVQRGALGGQFRDGQWWVHLGPRRGEKAIVCLWHGTSKDRVEALVDRGFWMVTGGKQVWLTTSELRARIHAIGRARRRRGLPVVMSCEVDLERYPIFWRRSSHVYVFHQPLGPEVITSVQEVDERGQSRRYRMEIRRRARRNSVNIDETRNSGALGILLWINTYLDTHVLEPVTVENPIVQDIIEWVDQEYGDGRDSAIAEEELEAKSRTPPFASPRAVVARRPDTHARRILLHAQPPAGSPTTSRQIDVPWLSSPSGAPSHADSVERRWSAW